MVKILIVDEDTIVIDALTWVIGEAMHAEITVVKNCSDAIRHFDTNTYDFIILDLQLPMGDLSITNGIVNEADHYYGISLLFYFKGKNKDVKIIGFSIDGQPLIVKLFTDAGADYLHKLDINSHKDLLAILMSKNVNS